MATPPQADGKGNENTEKAATYKIPEEYQFVDCYGRGNIYSQRVGYTLLSMVNYKTKSPCGSIKLPLPDTFHIPSVAQWNPEDESGLAEFTAKAMAMDLGKGEITKDSLIQDASQAAIRFGAKAVMDTPLVKGFLRSQGLAYNPNKQMYYNGPDFATQQFAFKLMPRNAKEAILMYEVCKIILRCTLPGSQSLTSELSDIIKQIGGKIGSDPQSAEQFAQKATGILDSLGNVQSPFFQYPNLWNLAIFVTQEGRSGNPTDKCVFQWNTLALSDYRIDFGTNIKWHADGYPTNVSVTMQFTETVLRTYQNLKEQMPYIIVPT